MKIIDILDKMADGTLEDGFSFKYSNHIWTYKDDNIYNEESYIFGLRCCIERHLNDEVEVIEDVKKIEEIEIKKDEDDDEFIIYKGKSCYLNTAHKLLIDKTNELVQAVNELKKSK